MDLMDLAAAWTVAGLAVVAVVGAGAGFGGFVLGCMTVTAQFIFMMASILHDGRPRMPGPGVSATYQYECDLARLNTRTTWLLGNGAMEWAI